MSDNRECRADEAPIIEAPGLPYLPRNPRAYDPGLALIGCGGITPYHLAAYKRAGYRVVALCDINRARAEERRGAFYPAAQVVMNYEDILRRDDVDVVDIATHTAERVPIIEAALVAKKHVLSQKPFVTNLEQGRMLVDLADAQGVKLAVNQNGRWAPHFSYARQAVERGLIGRVMAAHLAVHWDHNWTAETPFNDMKHLILYDFAIHWFDMVTCFLGDREPTRVYASARRSTGQRARPPLLAQVHIEYPDAQASLVFDADTRYGACDETVVIGDKGTICSTGPDLNTQSVTISLEEGRGTPALEGDWFTNGFHGTMAELLCSIEEGREPHNNARHNLRSLALCFAALASAETGQPVRVGSVSSMPNGTI
jgi:predicted dehydrogenase